MVLRASIVVLVLLAMRLAAAGEPGSGLYAEDCRTPDTGFAVEIAADGTAEVTAGGEVYADLLTSYSFFGVRTPADFHIAVLFGRERSPVPMKDGAPGWLEIWKGEAAYYLLVNGETAPRYSFCAEVARREVWSCSEKNTKLQVTAFKTEPETIKLVRGNESTTAIQRRSGSGVRYLGSSGVVFWMKGREATLEWPQGTDEQCRYQGPLGE